MKIVVNDMAVVPNSGGVYTILQDFYQEIIDTNDTNEWVFLLSGNYLAETNNIKIISIPSIKTNWIKRIFFELFYGKKIINKLQPDVYLSLQNTMTFGVKANKKIAYVHQPLSFQNDIKFSLFKKSERNLAIHQKFIGKFINFSLKYTHPTVIVQTSWMKRAIISRKISYENNIKILKPKETDFSFDPVNTSTRTFFFPAIIRTYKNHKVIIEAVSKLNRMGISNYNVQFTGVAHDLKEYKPMDNKIQFCGIIDREAVYRKYSNSILIFPSLMETYGLPLAEAKSAGTIIFAADLEYAHEVLEGYSNAYFFDPNSAEELAQLMNQFLKNKIKFKKSQRLHKNEFNEPTLLMEVLDV